jgi:prepilin-type N-terminal cleavage/methylation domain-containing protein
MKKIKQKLKKSLSFFKRSKSIIAFTIIELLVVIAIIGLLASILLISLNGAREKARRVTAFANIKQMQKALEMYFNDNGFYPPDISRGWDPGLVKKLPYNITTSLQDCNTDLASCVCGVYLSCTVLPANVPSDWIAQAQSRWGGPYVALWPPTTPWGGTYDYNNWDTITVRNGCNVPAGIYLGIESGSGFTLNPTVEQQLFNDGLDNDGCSNNGEAQLLLIKF